jgi:hypothetical protein
MAALPVTIALTKIKCLIETDEVGADEPYVLVTAIDLKNFPLPAVEVTKYGPWKDIDKGDTATTMAIQPGVPIDSLPFIVWRRPAWGPGGSPKGIAHPDDAILLLSVMEHDDGDTSATRTIVKGAVVTSLAASTGMSRAQRVAKLIGDINGALEIPAGAPNFDDRVGSTQEFRLSSNLLNVAGGPKNKTLTFRGDGGKYEVTMQVKKG